MQSSRKNATIRDVAERAGVSISTVSHVLNLTRRVEDATRDRILDAVKLLDYRPNQFARSLRGAGSRTIGLIISDIREDFFAAITKTIESAANGRGYTVILCDSEEDLEKERLYLDILSDKGVEGIILAPVDSASPPVLPRGRKLPLVQIDRRVPDAGLDYVGIDNARCAALAARHLAALGRRRIGFVGHEQSISTMRERVEGFKGAMSELGLGEGAALSVPARGGEPKGRIGRWMATNRVDAVVCGNATICFSVFEALEGAGRTVPGDAAVLSFDDPKYFRFMKSPVTAIRQPTERMGLAALDALLRRMTVAGEPEPVERMFQARLVVRESCGSRTARKGARA